MNKNAKVVYLPQKKAQKITSLMAKANELAEKGLSWTKTSAIVDTEIETFCKENGIDENEIWSCSFKVEE